MYKMYSLIESAINMEVVPFLNINGNVLIKLNMYLKFE